MQEIWKYLSKSVTKRNDGVSLVKQILLIACSLFFLFFSVETSSAMEDTNVRVGLASQVTQADFRVTQGEYQLIDSASGFPVGSPQVGERWSVRKEGYSLKVYCEDTPLELPLNGPLVLTPVDEAQTNVFRYQNVQYRDKLILQNETNGILVVNSIDIEKYLYGVVGKEIGTSVAIEALKAQAVVSRTYALANKGKSIRYDVGADTSSQVYGGYDAELAAGWEKVKESVDSTRGLVIYYQGKLIQAYFHANAGGYTETSENVWNESLPYLKAVASPEDDYAEVYPYQTSSGWPANSYRWVLNITRNELNSKIENWNALSSNKIEVGEINDLIISRAQSNSGEETVSKRVTRLDFVGSSGQKSFVKDGIRPVLGLKSTLFDLTLDSTIAVINGSGQQSRTNLARDLLALGAGQFINTLNGTNAKYYILAANSLTVKPKRFENITITGRGHGHGLGLSQWGAIGMAEKGYKYAEIIEYYYNQGNKDGKLTIDYYSQGDF